MDDSVHWTSMDDDNLYQLGCFLRFACNLHGTTRTTFIFSNSECAPA